MKRVWRSVLATLLLAGAMVGLMTTPASASTLVKKMRATWAGHTVETRMYESNGSLYLAAELWVGNLPDFHCLEVWHNVDTNDPNFENHRSGDLIMGCAANTHQSYATFWLYRQSSGVAQLSEINNIWLKGIAMCVVDQRTLFRNADTCENPWTEGWDYRPGANPSYQNKVYVAPHPEEYNGYNLNDMFHNTPDLYCTWYPSSHQKCRELRALAGDHWKFDNLNQTTRVIGGGSTWTSWYGYAADATRYLMVFQTNGDLVVWRVDSINGAVTAKWSSGTWGMPGAQLHLQGDGNMVIWWNGQPRWHSGTYQFGTVTDWRNGHNNGLFCANTVSQGCKALIYGGHIGPMLQSRWAWDQGQSRSIDVAGNGSANGTDVHSWPSDGNSAQRWQIVPDGSGVRIQRYDLPGKCLDLDIGYGNNGNDNGVQIQTWDCTGGNNQRWWQEDMGGGWFRFRSQWSNKCIDLKPEGGLDPGARIYQWDCHGGSNQQWRIN